MSDGMAAARDALVDALLRRGVISDARVRSAFSKVRREEFVPDKLRSSAYVDSPLPIGGGQTISAPHMVAIMAEALDLEDGMCVLEIGAGSGYHAAIVAEIIGPGGHVYSVERIGSLAEFAAANLERTGYSERVTVVCGDGSKGLPEHAPYERIFVACGAPDVPRPLTEQLSDGGKMLVPVGGGSYQELVKLERHGDRFVRKNLGGCVFVPLVGEHGH